jgi:hypothetical protein
MVARTILMSKVVLPIIKYIMAPLEIGPEFAFNWRLGEWDPCGSIYLWIFENLN